MNRSYLALMLLVLVLAASGAIAQPVAANSTATLQAGVPAISMFILPNGSGTPLAACYGPGGVYVSATIQVTIRDANNLPVANVPQRDIRLAPAGTNIGWCADTYYPPPPHAPNCADGATGPAGLTQFSLAYHGGGWHNSGMQVWVREASGNFAPIPNVLQVHMNSCDSNGDLIINLSDIANFAQDLQAFPAPYRSDYNWDGIINLSDIAFFAPTIGLTCP